MPRSRQRWATNQLNRHEQHCIPTCVLGSAAKALYIVICCTSRIESGAAGRLLEGPAVLHNRTKPQIYRQLRIILYNVQSCIQVYHTCKASYRSRNTPSYMLRSILLGKISLYQAGLITADCKQFGPRPLQDPLSTRPSYEVACSHCANEHASIQYFRPQRGVPTSCSLLMQAPKTSTRAAAIRFLVVVAVGLPFAIRGAPSGLRQL